MWSEIVCNWVAFYVCIFIYMHYKYLPVYVSVSFFYIYIKKGIFRCKGDPVQLLRRKDIAYLSHRELIGIPKRGLRQIPLSALLWEAPHGCCKGSIPFSLIKESRFLYFSMLGHTTDNSRVTGLLQRTKDLELFLPQLHSCCLGVTPDRSCCAWVSTLLLKPSWSLISLYITLRFSWVWMILAIFF